MVMCGKCKQHHATVEDVRACFESNGGRPVPRTTTALPPSQRSRPVAARKKPTPLVVPPGSVDKGGEGSYASGLVHRPSKRELAIGDRCEHCGAFIPSGSAHDC